MNLEVGLIILRKIKHYVDAHDICASQRPRPINRYFADLSIRNAGKGVGISNCRNHERKPRLLDRTRNPKPNRQKKVQKGLILKERDRVRQDSCSPPPASFASAAGEALSYYSVSYHGP